MADASLYLLTNDAQGRPSGKAPAVEVDFEAGGFARLQGPPIRGLRDGTDRCHIGAIAVRSRCYLPASAGLAWDVVAVDLEDACRILAHLRDLGWSLVAANPGLAFLWDSGAEINAENALHAVGSPIR